MRLDLGERAGPMSGQAVGAAVRHAPDPHQISIPGMRRTRNAVAMRVLRSAPSTPAVYPKDDDRNEAIELIDEYQRHHLIECQGSPAGLVHCQAAATMPIGSSVLLPLCGINRTMAVVGLLNGW